MAPTGSCWGQKSRKGMAIASGWAAWVVRASSPPCLIFKAVEGGTRCPSVVECSKSMLKKFDCQQLNNDDNCDDDEGVSTVWQ